MIPFRTNEKKNVSFFFSPLEKTISLSLSRSLIEYIVSLSVSLSFSGAFYIIKCELLLLLLRETITITTTTTTTIGGYSYEIYLKPAIPTTTKIKKWWDARMMMRGKNKLWISSSTTTTIKEAKFSFSHCWCVCLWVIEPIWEWIFW